MKGFEDMNSREKWDFLDEIFLRHKLNIKQMAELLGLDESEYIELRRNRLPLPSGTTEKVIKKFSQQI